MNKLAHIEAIDRGKGLQYVIDAAYTILNKPLVLFDTHYSLIANAGEVHDDPIWNTLITTGSYDTVMQKFFASEGFFDQIAYTNKNIILRSNNLKHARMLGYIYNGEKIKVAALAMFEMDTPFDQEDSSLFLKLSDIIEDEIHDDTFYTEYGRAFHEEIITMLLDKVIEDRFIFTPHIQIIYDGFSEYLYIAVVEAPYNGNQNDRNKYIKSMLMQTYKSYKFAIYSGYIIMLMSSKYMIAFEELFADRFFTLFDQYNLYAGISESFENPYDMHEYYDKAVAALEEGKIKNIAQRIY